MPSRTKEEFIEYADGDEAFAAWLEAVDARVLQRTAVGIFDHPDYLWRDAFDNDSDPTDAADDFISAEGIDTLDDYDDDDAPSEDLDAIEEEEDLDDDDDADLGEE